jgi:hypothetical protein
MALVRALQRALVCATVAAQDNPIGREKVSRLHLRTVPAR